MTLYTDLFEGPIKDPGLITDTKNFESIRELIAKWLSTQNFIKRMRQKGKKIVGLCLPPCDLIYAFPNAIPILPLRLYLGTYNGLSHVIEHLNNTILEAEKYGCESDQCVQVRTIFGSILLTKEMLDFWIGPQTCDKMTKVWEMVSDYMLPTQLVDAPHKTRDHDLEKMRAEFDLLMND